MFQCEGNKALCTTGSLEVSFPLVFLSGMNGEKRQQLWTIQLESSEAVSESFIHAVLHILQSKVHSNTVVCGTRACVLA